MFICNVVLLRTRYHIYDVRNITAQTLYRKLIEPSHQTTGQTDDETRPLNTKPKNTLREQNSLRIQKQTYDDPTICNPDGNRNYPKAAYRPPQQNDDRPSQLHRKLPVGDRDGSPTQSTAPTGSFAIPPLSDALSTTPLCTHATETR